MTNKIVLHRLFSWHNWENRVFQQNPGNPSRAFLDELFDNWN